MPWSKPEPFCSTRSEQGMGGREERSQRKEQATEERAFSARGGSAGWKKRLSGGVRTVPPASPEAASRFFRRKGPEAPAQPGDVRRAAEASVTLDLPPSAGNSSRFKIAIHHLIKPFTCSSNKFGILNNFCRLNKVRTAQQQPQSEPGYDHSPQVRSGGAQRDALIAGCRRTAGGVQARWPLEQSVPSVFVSRQRLN
uniref:Uncharacterized protein n=1 Tax=Rangifer tarandus platyrhynchus TaxID=3082113 RepID=A0ACB0DYF6_RANTA|nr:unnamed protein product [Rangifer tarandus platyrhynchus]